MSIQTGQPGKSPESPNADGCPSETYNKPNLTRQTQYTQDIKANIKNISKMMTNQP